MSKVGKYFDIAEFTISQTAARKGLDNTPTPEVEACITALVEKILDPLREKLGIPVVINSGYRSPKVNASVGGARNSQHVKGEAADFIVPGLSVSEVVSKVREMKLPFDQLIDEFGEWVHVSYRPSGRQEVLKAKVTKKGVVYERMG
jgi:zinc D-Ala-D-Ala carboxypeptidase